MKTLLVAINSQYIHSNHAVWCLKAACDNQCGEVKVVEFSINEPLERIFAGIAAEGPDVAAFSCYIWNIEPVVKVAADLKKAFPGIVIVMGGPEVSFENGGLAFSCRCADYIIAGEGEEKFRFLLKRLSEESVPNEQEIKWLGSFSVIPCMDSLPSPYRHISKGSLKNRIAYIEASRGCPFKCAYCISSITDGVRTLSLEKVGEALEILVESGSKIIKFVDRTFNCDESRALLIWDEIRKYAGNSVVFHFEMDPGLISERMISFLSGMPAGLIQIEAGIQSVNTETLKAVNRPCSVGRALSNLSAILSLGNIHVHADLIAGLPNEGYSCFRESFNLVYGLFAHHFQLGFLKLLRGSPLRENADKHGYVFRDYPPYEIISNRYITAGEILALKDIEECVGLFYNSGNFAATMKWLGADRSGTGMDNFEFYELLSEFMRQEGYLGKPIKTVRLYEIFLMFLGRNFPCLLKDAAGILRLDYLRSMKNPALPDCLMQKEDNIPGKSRQKAMMAYRSDLERVLPRLRSLTLEEIWHQVYISEFTLPECVGFPRNSLIAVDFGDISPVTKLAGAYLIEDRSGF